MPEKSGIDAAPALPLLVGPTAGAASCPNAAAPTPSSIMAAMAAIANGFFMMTLSRLEVLTARLPRRTVLLPADAQFELVHMLRRSGCASPGSRLPSTHRNWRVTAANGTPIVL